MFNIDKAHMIIDEMIMNGYITETNKNRALAPIIVLDKATAKQWAANVVKCSKFAIIFEIMSCLIREDACCMHFNDPMHMATRLINSTL